MDTFKIGGPQRLSYRRGKEDSDSGGYGCPGVIPCGKGYNDTVIPRLCTLYSKLLLLFEFPAIALLQYFL
jgi:hypothetical protein